MRVKCPPFLIHFWNILSMRMAHLHTSKCECTLHAGATKIFSICNRGLKFGTCVELQPLLNWGAAGCWVVFVFSLPLAQRLDDPFSTLESEILQGGIVISALNRCKWCKNIEKSLLRRSFCCLHAHFHPLSPLCRTLDCRRSCAIQSRVCIHAGPIPIQGVKTNL